VPDGIHGIRGPVHLVGAGVTELTGMAIPGIGAVAGMSDMQETPTPDVASLIRATLADPPVTPIGSTLARYELMD
jgi:hypothetical protein